MKMYKSTLENFDATKFGIGLKILRTLAYYQYEPSLVSICYENAILCIPTDWIMQKVIS